MARRLGVKGKPGPHNWLEFIVPSLWATRDEGLTFIITPEMAQHLYDYGFKSKDEIYEWIWKKTFEPLKEYRNRSWPDFFTLGWTGIDPASGKPWKELPHDAMVPVLGDPWEICIIVAGGEEESTVQFGGGHGAAFSIDAWR
jgi:hypothetical protein